MAVDAARVKSLFLAASDLLDAADRAAFLSRECGDDVELRARVEALLRANDEAPTFGPVDATGMRGSEGQPQTEDFADPTARVGTLLGGKYKLVEVIGEGGMGSVFMAQQTEPVKRVVAVKVVKAGMDSRALLARFEAERQALAMMDHPNIARVLDAGTTDGGRPFFVMELVKGVPITRYCDDRKLTPRQRLELFVPVCQAIQHAHQKGVIHRDIKPSNVLVAMYDDRAVPKVIDFGVAKAAGQTLTDKTLLTGFGAVVGTPEYMSPEQANLNNLDVDTRSDVYSLGVLLYELLTGSTPVDRKSLGQAALLEVLRIVREVEAPKPSAKLSSGETSPSVAANRGMEPAKLSKLLKGELDWVLLKALEKDRTRRYETANGLARDIQRYLNDEVVEARPPSAAYRLKKYVRRHKGRVIAAVLVSATLLGGVAAVVGVQAVANTRLSASLDRETRANEDLAAANDELTRSRAAVQARYDLALDAIKTIHMGDSEEWFLKEERFKKLRDRRLKSAADFYVKLGALLGKETDAASRRALAQSNFELAKLTAKIGNQEAALEAHRAVLAVREALAAEPEADAGVKTDVGRSLTEVATLLDAAGKTDEALTTYRRAETALSGPAKSDPAARAAQAACRSRIGQILFNMNKTAEALAVFEQARAAQEVLRLETGDSKESRRDLADTLVRIGRLQWYWADLEGARANYQSALMIMGTLADDDDIDLRNSVANVHRGLSGVLEFTGSLAGSELEARQALAIWQALFDENPAVTDFGIRLATCRSGLGRLLADMGRTSEAEIETRAALTLLQKLNNDNPTDSRVRYVSLIVHYNQGILLLQAGKPAEAEAECRTALEILREIVKESPSVTLYRNALPFYIDSLADVIRNRGRSAEAKTLYEETIALKEPDVRTYPKDPEHGYGLICSTWRRGQTLRDLGDPAGAAAEIRRALGMCGVLPPRYHRYVFETACCHAALAGLAGLKGSGVTAAEADKEAALAIEWLRRAKAMGYCNVNEIRIESAFNSLRGREDFKKLLAEMAANAKAGAE